MRKVSTVFFFGLLLSLFLIPSASAAVTEAEVTELLADYDLSKEELEVILAEFGTTIQEHESKEELNNALDFYLSHLSVMKDLEEFLASIGITETEANLLFEHFDEIDSGVLQQEMVSIDTQVEELMMNSDTPLSLEEATQLTSLFEKMIRVFQLTPSFFWVDVNGIKEAVSYEELVQSNTLSSGTLLVQLFDKNGKYLADIELPTEMISGEFVLSAFEKIADVGELAGTLPDTASTYISLMLLGLVLTFSGISLFFIRKKAKNLS